MRNAIFTLLVLGQTAFAGTYVRAGAYRIDGGGILHTTCPNVDSRPVRELSWWTIRNAAAGILNVRQSLNFDFSAKAEPESRRFGWFPMKSIGYGGYEGVGFLLERVAGPLGVCTIRRELRAKLDVFTETMATIRGTIKQSVQNPHEAPICQAYDLILCETGFEHQLSFASPE